MAHVSKVLRSADRRGSRRVAPALAAGMMLGLVTLPASPLSAETLKSCFEATLEASGDKAIDICGKLLATGLPPGRDLAVVLNNRGLGYLKNSEMDKPADQIEDDLDTALEYFERSVAMDPGYAYAYDNRGDAYRRKRDNTRALADYSKALEIEPTFTSAYLGRGKVYEAMDDRNRARAEYKAALSQTGTRPIDKWAREQAQMRLERIDAPK